MDATTTTDFRTPIDESLMGGIHLVLADGMASDVVAGLRKTLAEVGMAVSEEANVELRGVYEFTQGGSEGPSDSAGDFSGRSLVSLAQEAGGNVSMALDLGIEVAAMLLVMPPPSPCIVKLSMPREPRSYAFSVVAEKNRNSWVGAHGRHTCMRRAIPRFSVLSNGMDTTDQEVLEKGRVAVSVGGRMNGIVRSNIHNEQWAEKLLDVLAARWQGLSRCSCC